MPSDSSGFAFSHAANDLFFADLVIDRQQCIEFLRRDLRRVQQGTILRSGEEVNHGAAMARNRTHTPCDRFHRFRVSAGFEQRQATPAAETNGMQTRADIPMGT